MLKAATGTNDLGMHIDIRPISKVLLSKDETVGIETEKINSLLTARRTITLVDAISDCLQGLSEDRYLSELRDAVPSKWNRFLERCLLASVPNGSTP